MNKQNLLAIGGVAFGAALVGALIPTLIFGGVRNDSARSDSSAPAESGRKEAKKPTILKVVGFEKGGMGYADMELRRACLMGYEIRHIGADYVLLEAPLVNPAAEQAIVDKYFKPFEDHAARLAEKAGIER